MEFNIKFKIEQQLIEDLIVTSFEGGSGYGMEYSISNEIQKQWNPSNYANQIIENKWEIEVFDREEPENKLGAINIKNIQRGLNLLSKYPYTLGNILTGDYDGNDADVFMQLVVMGEVIYG